MGVTRISSAGDWIAAFLPYQVITVTRLAVATGGKII